MGILRINVDDAVRIEASRARVHVTLTGSSAVMPGTAARKAAEVRDLVAALADQQLGEDAIEITSVRAENGQGWLTRGQKVEIELVVAAQAAQLPGVLGVLTARPGLRVDDLEWVYDEFEASIAATAEAMVKARRKADAIAAAAGQRIVAIVEASDSWSRPSPRLGAPVATRMMALGAAKAAPELDLGLELNSTTELAIHLSVDFEMEV